jgi:dienelactone hydrolase
MRRRLRLLVPTLLAVALVGGTVTTATAAAAASHIEGTLASGATYVMDVPANWNGTVLLYSHGYVVAGSPNPARNAPSPATRDALLADGYALIGSSYARTGWAIEEALADQMATLDAFTDQFGRARKTFAWGTSMGGMVTTALAERVGQRFAGALAMCGLQQGAVANFNSTLDPVFAVKTLLAPDADVPIVRIPDQGAAFGALGVLSGALNAAQQTPLGRARIALAAALHNIPAWTDPAQPEPAPDDYDTAQLHQFQTLGLTLYVGLSWRQEAEVRAGGNMSWNLGVDYGRMLERSPALAEVRALYERAGGSLDADLATLANAPRILPDLAAVLYMARYVSFTGRLRTPLMTIHTTGDPLVPVQVQQAYDDTTDDAGRGWLLRQAFVHRAGHCTFTTGEMLAALRTVERRAATGSWSGTDANSLNALAASIDAAPAAYEEYRPAPYPRPFDLAIGH